MKTLTRLALLMFIAAPAVASANCYFVYSGKNDLVYRSTVSPIDLSKSISDGVRRRFSSGGHLVMIPDETGCPDLLANGESKLFATLGFQTPGGRSAIAASPLFREDSGDVSDAPAADGSAQAVGEELRGRPAGRRGTSAGRAR